MHALRILASKHFKTDFIITDALSFEKITEGIQKNSEGKALNVYLRNDQSVTENLI